MKKTKYTFEFQSGPEELVVHHDPDETGVDIEREYDRWVQINELSGWSFSKKLQDFRNFLWSELGLTCD